MSLEVKIEELTKVVAELNENIAKIIISSGVQATKTENTTPSIPEPEKEPEEPKKRKRRTKAEIEAEEDKTEEVRITLGELKDLAQAAVGRSDRATVKATIGEYADKLSDVKEINYSELAEKLKAL